MQYTCEECHSFIVYPEKYSGDCPRCIVLAQVSSLRSWAELHGHYLSKLQVLEKLDEILEYQPAASPFREDGTWPHLSHSAE